MPIQTSLKQGAVRTPARFALSVVMASVATAYAPALMAQEQKLAATIVTATRTATAQNHVVADTVVITREQIEAFGPGRSVVDVLQRLANVQINSNGGRGQTQSVFIRGAESKHVLLLIDGARLGSASGGSPSFANLPLEQIERIEVLKGSASSLYGSEAIGGVIQIFTHRKHANAHRPLAASGSVTLGKNNHKSANIALQGAQEGLDYRLGVARIVDHGFSVQKNSGFIMDLDRDGFDQTSWNVGLGYQINGDWRTEASLLQSRGNADYDSGWAEKAPFNKMTTQVSRLALMGQVTPDWHSTWSISESVDRSENKDHTNTSRSLQETQQTEYKWELRTDTPLGAGLVALERLEQTIDTATAVTTPTARTIDALIFGLNGSASAHTWQGSLRRDDNSQFGGYTSYGINYGYEFVKGLRAYAAHGRSMRAPSFDELYAPSYAAYGSPGWAGNPNLQPEKSKNFELGLQYQLGEHRAKFVRYDNRVTNLIEQGSSSDLRQNAVGTTRLKGWTAEYGIQHGAWDTSVAYDRLHARHADGSTPLNRADSQVSLNISHTQDAWTVGASAVRIGSRMDYSGKKLNPYATVDLSAQYQMTRALVLQARIANATDRDYVLADGYNQLGRAAYVTLKWITP